MFSGCCRHVRLQGGKQLAATVLCVGCSLASDCFSLSLQFSNLRWSRLSESDKCRWKTVPSHLVSKAKVDVTRNPCTLKLSVTSSWVKTLPSGNWPLGSFRYDLSLGWPGSVFHVPTIFSASVLRFPSVREINHWIIGSFDHQSGGFNPPSGWSHAQLIRLH